MNAREVNRIVDTICEADVKCPVFAACAACDCNGSNGECPIKDALHVARQAMKQEGGAK